MKKIALFISLLIIVALACGLLFIVPYIEGLDQQITDRFEGKRWQLPARIYTRPLELYVGKNVSVKALEGELIELHYRRQESPIRPGEYSVKGRKVTIYSRSFPFPDTHQAATLVQLDVTDETISRLIDPASKEPVDLFRLEPIRYASIYPKHNEDRLLVKLGDVPKLLINTLLLIEDKTFYSHRGIRPATIVRASLANLKAGKAVQGGSTLTQQLVKNLFLSNERTLKRKINEAIMSLLLEYHYGKDEILEAYLNEVYLGQDGKRAIHGFAMASRFYFDRDLGELKPDQLALLVGMVKGASYYNPRYQSERATKRRNQVLDLLTTEQQFSPESAKELKEKPLGVIPKSSSEITPYPAFVQLVRRQLSRDYRDEDLRSEGLSIFTTLDPTVQHQAEQSLVKELVAIESKNEETGQDSLQAALVIASVDQGEVVAVVGSRLPRETGFNRALDMKRSVGSIIKPAVFLTALARPESYNLLTTLYDTPVTIPMGGGENYQPQNYDHLYRGPLPLIEALIHSYNVPTVQLGMELGLESVIDMLKQLGIQEKIPSYPSLLLGAVELPPIEMLQMYQTIAAGGYKTPLRAILAVTDQQNNTLQRYPLTVQQSVDPSAIVCLTAAMQAITTRGTARSLPSRLPPGLTVAGKTGTTDNLRDSWFAGFSGRHVAVAWVGRDDNKPTGLTGATGALGVWARAMTEIDTSPLEQQASDTIDWYYTDITTGKLLRERCEPEQETLLPFIREGILPEAGDCPKPEGSSLEETLEEGLETLLNIFR